MLEAFVAVGSISGFCVIAIIAGFKAGDAEFPHVRVKMTRYVALERNVIKETKP